MNVWPDLRPVLHDLRWAIVGGVATRAYMPERMTKDLDIVIHPDDADEVWERLKAAGYRFVTELGVPGYLVRSPEGTDVDVVIGHYRWINEALAQPERDPADYPVIGLPYLIMMKIEASRGVDIGDLTRMLGLASDEQLDKVRQIVARYAPDEKDDLESTIFIGKREMLFPPKLSDKKEE